MLNIDQDRTIAIRLSRSYTRARPWAFKGTADPKSWVPGSQWGVCKVTGGPFFFAKSLLDNNLPTFVGAAKPKANNI